jgi:hypothetical protein
MLALNQNQPDRPDIAYYANEFFNRLVAKRLLLQRDSNNIIKISVAISKFEDDDDIDKKLDEALQTLQRAGFGNIGNDILRLMARKISLDAVASPPADASSENALAADGVANASLQNQGVGDGNAVIIGSDQRRPSKRQRVDGGFNVDRMIGKDLDTKSKLAKLRDISLKVAVTSVNNYTGALRSFYYSTLTPIMTCLKDHCNDDDSEFARRWTDKRRSRAASIRAGCCDRRLCQKPLL